jgi:hypothetical protein
MVNWYGPAGSVWRPCRGGERQPRGPTATRRPATRQAPPAASPRPITSPSKLDKTSAPAERKRTDARPPAERALLSVRTGACASPRARRSLAPTSRSPPSHRSPPRSPSSLEYSIQARSAPPPTGTGRRRAPVPRARARAAFEVEGLFDATEIF